MRDVRELRAEVNQMRAGHRDGAVLKETAHVSFPASNGVSVAMVNIMRG